MDEQAIEDRRHEAQGIVNTYMGWSTGAAFLPVPYVDLAAVTAIQIKMVADLSELYEVPFSKNVAKGVIAGLLGAVLPATAARGVASFIKAIPGVGTFLGVITAPAFASASTYAVGRVFVQHFESGGTLLTFDPDAVREHFKEEFESGKKASGSSKAAA